jgi:hypothetical protein
VPACEGEEGMDEFELEDNLEFILQSIQELMEDPGDNNAFGDANQNELFASIVNYDQVCYRCFFRVVVSSGDHCFVGDEILIPSPRFFPEECVIDCLAGEHAARRVCSGRCCREGHSGDPVGEDALREG